MEIEIKVSTPAKDLNQRELQSIRRVANVLRANGFEVDIVHSTLTVVKNAC